MEKTPTTAPSDDVAHKRKIKIPTDAVNDVNSPDGVVDQEMSNSEFIRAEPANFQWAMLLPSRPNPVSSMDLKLK